LPNQVSWDGVSDVEGFNCYRSNTEVGPYTKLNTTLITDTTYVDSDVVEGVTYYYKVTSVDSLGHESVPSAAITITAYSTVIKEMIDDLRVMILDKEVKDDVWCAQFTDEELYVYLKKALKDINAHPYVTDYTLDTAPEDWEYLICLGAQIMAYIALGVVEKGREFEITDQGISFMPPRIGDYLQAHASNLMTTYADLKEKIKLHYRPNPRAVGTFRVLAISPAYLRLRHLRQRRII